MQVSQIDDFWACDLPNGRSGKALGLKLDRRTSRAISARTLIHINASTIAHHDILYNIASLLV